MAKGSNDYSAPPQQKKMFKLFRPAYEQFANAAFNQAGQPNYGAPSAPTMPSATGIYSNIPMYDLPNAVQPTAQWYNSLSPEVMAGVWAPYQDASNQLLETLGASGQRGNARAGYSGAAGAALGSFAADASKNVGLQAWQMSQPGLMADYQSQLSRNMQGYTNLTNEAGMNYQNEANRLGQDYGAAMQAWNIPYGMMGAAQNITPTSAFTPGGSPTQSGMGMATQLGTGYLMGK